MKTKFLLIILCLATCFVTSAQAKNSSYDKGYRPNIGIGIQAAASLKPTYGITTSHGYNWGNGLYWGVMTGVRYTPEERSSKPDRILIPFLAEVKYSFINRLASPFVALKAGGIADLVGKGVGYEVLPSVGVDIWRFSLSVGFDTYKCTCRTSHQDAQEMSVRSSAVAIGRSGVHVGVSYWF